MNKAVHFFAILAAGTSLGATSIAKADEVEITRVIRPEHAGTIKTIRTIRIDRSIVYSDSGQRFILIRRTPYTIWAKRLYGSYSGETPAEDRMTRTGVRREPKTDPAMNTEESGAFDDFTAQVRRQQANPLPEPGGVVITDR
jgi:hypothetical protein